MAILSVSRPTLLDVVKQMAPDGTQMAIAEMLTQSNDILLDMPWKQGNLTTGMRTTVRTGLPAVAWRLLNAGVQPSKSTVAQIDETAGKLEAWSEVDKALAMLSGNANSFRIQEARAFIEAMNQEFAQTLFYGNSSVSPEEFTGLAPRYSVLSGAPIAQNVIAGGGAGSDNTSIWLIGWGEDKITGIFPKGSVGGLNHYDLGEETAENVNGVTGALMRVYRDQFVWDAGIAVRDWRYAVRAANIDVSNLVANTSAADLINLMIRTTHRLPRLTGDVRPVFYMNRTVFAMLDIQRRDDVIAGGGLIYKDVDGFNTPTFRGIPIRVVDSILNTEALVS